MNQRNHREDTLKYSIKFSFPSSKNIKGLIARMKLARKLQDRKFVAHNDSQLVVQQFQEEYEAREPTIAQHLRKLLQRKQGHDQ